MGQLSTGKINQENSILSFDRINMLEELMGSIAHEVRNPLAVVRGNLQILLWKEDLGSQHPDFKMMIEQLDGAMELLTEFLQTLKPQLNVSEETDINAVILSVKRLLEAEAVSQGHCLRFDLDKSVPAMETNPSQMIHLLYNMCFIAFRYLDMSGDVVIGTHMQDDRTLVCSVVSSVPGGDLSDAEKDSLPEEINQMTRVGKKIAQDLNGSLEVQSLGNQGARIVAFFAL